MNFIKAPFLLLILLNISSQSNKIGPLDFTNANKIEIRFLKAKKLFSYTATNKDHLAFFKNLIKKGKERHGLKCDTTGEILYLKNDKILLKIYFSTRVSGSKYSSSAMVYTINNHINTSLLTYNTGMIIDEEFYRLQKIH
jgi:hypothetical protein